MAPAAVDDLANLPGKPELYGEVAVRAAGADAAVGDGVVRRAARLMNVLAQAEKKKRGTSGEASQLREVEPLERSTG